MIILSILARALVAFTLFEVCRTRLVAPLQQWLMSAPSPSLELPEPQPEPVNFIGGVVFPAPHDPRWQEHAGTGTEYSYRFGDEIEVKRTGVFVRIGFSERPVFKFANATAGGPLFRAIEAARDEFDRAQAAARARSAALGPSLTEDEWAALELYFPADRTGPS